MKILELFAGTRSIGKAFEAAGHEVYSIEWDKKHENIDWYADISKIQAHDILTRFGRPDVIWASPDCTSYSIAAISHHRTREPDGNLMAKSEYASFCDLTNQHVLKLIKDLNPRLYFIENPRGGLRKMKFMQQLPRYTVTYCQYGDTRMKPTDIWTNLILTLNSNHHVRMEHPAMSLRHEEVRLERKASKVVLIGPEFLKNCASILQRLVKST